MKKTSSLGTSSAQKPAKKPKLGIPVSSSGGLLKFGFTGVKGEPIPSPSPAEYSQCPLCSGLFNTMAIVEHASTCMGEERVPSASVDIFDPVIDSSQQGEHQSKTNAFDLMRKSAALKPVIAAPSIMHLALILKEEKLLPVFSASADYIEQLYTQCTVRSDQPPNWTCEANVKKFRWHFDHTAPSHRDIRLHVSTNIQPDLGVSFADTALISAAWLKSMLQKAVRRKLSFKAVKLANMMCRTNPAGVNQNQNKTVGSPVGSPVKSRPASQTNIKSNTTSKPIGTASNTTLLSELLRRLPIICVEDAALHPSYPLLIWLMVAVSKGYIPPKCLLQVVLMVTHDIAVCTYKDCIPPYEYDLCPPASSTTSEVATSTSCAVDAAVTIDPTNTVTATTNTTTPSNTITTIPTTTTTNTTNTTKTTNTAPTTTSAADTMHPLHTWEGIENDSIRTLLACICIRASFGGMVGDMQMLDKFAQLWYVRLLCDHSNNNAKSVGEKTSGSGGVSVSGGSSGSSGSGSGGTSSAIDTVSSMCSDGTIGYAGMVPDSIKCCLHPSYSNALFQPNCSVGWAGQLYTNFQPGSGMTDKTAVFDECTTLAANVERMLVSKCTQYNTTNTTYNTTSLTRPAQTLTTLLKVALYDLVPEGLDQHCDYSLLPAILNSCNDKVQQLTLLPPNDVITSTLTILRDPHLEANIKSAIWLFRSANNSRKLYPYMADNAQSDVSRCISVYYQELVDSDLAQKAKLARLWGVVCPMIVAYCDRKMVALSHRL